MVSHFLWTKKQIRHPNSFAADRVLLSDPSPPPTHSHLPLSSRMFGPVIHLPGLGSERLLRQQA